MTEQERRAVEDAYTTLRAVCNTFGKHDDVLAGICAESERLLVEAFPEVARLEDAIDERGLRRS